MQNGTARRVDKMATKHVVDTHALVWFLEGNPRLGANAKAILEDADSNLIVPVIALAEACWIIERERTSIPEANTSSECQQA